MNYGEIKKTDIANGFGVRYPVLYPDAPTAARTASTARTWDFSMASPSPPKREEELLEALAPGFVNGLRCWAAILRDLQPAGVAAFPASGKKAFPGKDIWCYTGAVLDRDLIPDGHYFCEAPKKCFPSSTCWWTALH